MLSLNSLNTKQLTTGRALVLLDQAVVSGGNFLLGVLLARLLGLAAFGTFSLLWMGALFALGLHQAYFTQPLMSLYAGKTAEEQGGYLRNLLQLQLLLSAMLVALSALSWAALEAWGGQTGWLTYLPVMGCLTAVYLLQDLLRRLFFVKNEYRQPFVMDLVLYGPLLLGLLGLHHFGQLDLGTALLALLAAYGLSSGLFLFRFANTGHSPKTTPWKTAKEHYHFSFWLLGTSLVQWLSGNFFLIAAAGVLGTVAVGALRMAQNMVGLSHVLFLAMENIVPAEAARQFFQHGKTKMAAYLRRTSLMAAVPFVLLLGALTLLSPWLIEALYGAEYLSYNYLVGAYAVLYLFVFAGYQLRFALRTLQRTAPIFVASCASAGLGLVAAFPLAREFGMGGVLGGLLAAQVLTLAVYLVFLWKWKRPFRSTKPVSPQHAEPVLAPKSNL